MSLQHLGQHWMRYTVVVCLAICVFLGFAAKGKAENQPVAVVAYFSTNYTGGCVMAGKPARVVFRAFNLSRHPQHVVLWLRSAMTYINVTAETSYGKGYSIPVSALKSGLVNTTSNPTWRWNDIAPEPGKPVTKIAYISRVPAQYHDQATGQKQPGAQFYFGADLNVHHSPMNGWVQASTVYCKDSA